MTWQPIATAPEPNDWLKHHGLFQCVLACLHEHRDEAGDLTGESTLLWSHVVYLSSDGWRLNSAGFKGLNGNYSFPINGNATHWMPLSPPTAKATGDAS